MQKLLKLLLIVVFISCHQKKYNNDIHLNRFFEEDSIARTNSMEDKNTFFWVNENIINYMSYNRIKYPMHPLFIEKKNEKLAFFYEKEPKGVVKFYHIKELKNHNDTDKMKIKFKNDTILLQYKKELLSFTKQKRRGLLVNLTSRIFYLQNENINIKILRGSEIMSSYNVKCRLSQSKNEILCACENTKLKMEILKDIPFIYNDTINAHSEQYIYFQDLVKDTTTYYIPKIEGNIINLYELE